MNLATLLFVSKIAWFVLRYGVYPLLLYQPALGIVMVGLMVLH